MLLYFCHTSGCCNIDKNGPKANYRYFDHYDKDFQDPRLNLITMAIFSSPDTYECSYKLLENNIVDTYNFYINKTNLLIEKSSNERTCSSNLANIDTNGNFNGDFQVKLYEDMLKALENSRDILEKEKFNKATELVNSINQIDLASGKLEEFDCLYVY